MDGRANPGNDGGRHDDHANDRTAARADLFGHPRGLAFLFATEMWERFSYYGMRALLVLYMVKYLLLPPQAGRVLGLASFKSALEAVFGPLDAALRLADLRLLHRARLSDADLRRAVGRPRARPAPHRHPRRRVDGGRPFHDGLRAFVPAGAALLILGSGCFKPNISTQVGQLYAPGDRRRDRAFSIFYVGINLGAFFSPLVCGTLGEIWLALRFCRRRRRHDRRP